MRIGLIDVDSHNFPNLALMKISAWHKRLGDSISFGKCVQRQTKSGNRYIDEVEGDYIECARYDKVYVSKVFDGTYSADIPFLPQADEVVFGGTGYDLKNKLPDVIENICPDYSLYGHSGSYGFCTRGCPRACGFCIVAAKEGRISKAVADVADWYKGGKIKLLDPNILACKDHMELLKQLASTKAPVDFTQGLDARMLTEDNINALNVVNIEMVHFAWDIIKDSDAVLRGLGEYKRFGKVQDYRKRKVYVLTNYDTTHEEDLYRIYKLREIGYDPDVRIYDKPNAPRQTRLVQRWVNNRKIWNTTPRFEDYDPKIG